MPSHKFPLYPSITQAWHTLLRQVIEHGIDVNPRGRKTIELVSNMFAFQMAYPVLMADRRRLGYRFMAAEAAWILSGDNRVSTIAPFSREISKFSDDGIFFNGAYGPKVVDQISYVAQNLSNDPFSRQAVMNIWREKPRGSADTPCTLNLQWMIREDALHCLVNMRSSDCWLGVPYDCFNFSVLSGMLALLMKKMDGATKPTRLGYLFFHAGSQHIYHDNLDSVIELLHYEPVSQHERGPNFNPDEFSSHDELIDYLWTAARDGVSSKFLASVTPPKA